MSGHHFRMASGAELLAPNWTRFRLWAPGCQSLELLLDGERAVPMMRDANGWFSGEAGVGAGAAYRYRLPSGQCVPDPASRRQVDSVHGASRVIDPTAYRWQCNEWSGRPWQEMVIYELHVGTFSPSRDFAGVREKLRLLAETGVTAIELMPIADFEGSRNWGYDGVLPYAPARAYGEVEALKGLVDAAHAEGLCVYLDVVYNHFGPSGNYLHSYAEPFFDAGRQSPWGAAIDFSHPVVRRFFTENALYWLMEYRFDGLRFDAVHAISQPDWLDEMAAAVRQAVEPGRHVHLMLENEHNRASHLADDFDAQWNDDGHNVLHVLLTGEGEGYYANYGERPAAKLARCLAEGFVYQGEVAPVTGKPRGTPSAHLAPQNFILFLQNHDQVGNRALGERLVKLADADALRAAIVLQLLAPQVPLLFMGEEWGATEPFLFFTDFHDELADAVREGRRNEFAAFAAFQSASSRAAIPDPNAPSTWQRSTLAWPTANELATHPVRAFYRLLIGLRRRHVIPFLSQARSLEARVIGEAAVIATWSLGAGGVLTIAINLQRDAVPLPSWRGRLLVSSRDDGIADEPASLPGYTARVWLSETEEEPRAGPPQR